LSASGAVCAGNNFTITATSTAPAPLTYFLTGGPGLTNIDSNTTGVFTVNATTSGNYTVTVRSFGFTSAPATLAYTIAASPVIVAGTATSPTTCGGTNGSFTITGLAPNTSYTLRYERNGVLQGPFTVTSSATGVVTATNLNAGNYGQIRVTLATPNAGNCTSNFVGPINVTDPSPPIPPQASHNPPLCLGSTLQLTSTSVYPNAIYTWTGPNGFSASTANATRNNLSFADTGLYSVTVSVAGCVSAPGTVRVFVNPPPPAPVTSNISLCQFSQATGLTALGQNLKWYTTATGGTPINPAPPVPSTTVAGTTTYYVSQTVNTCEGTARAPLVVTVIPRPAKPTGDVAPEICQFSQSTPLVVIGQNLLWYTTATGGTGSNIAPQPPTTQTGVQSYYVTQTVNGCESERQQIQVLVKPKPAPPAVASPLNLCQYDAAEALQAQGANIKWYEQPIGGPAIAVPVPFTGYEDTLTYYASQTVNGCESDRSLLNVIVNYKPNAGIVQSRDFICQFDTVSFTYLGNGRPTATYNWAVDGGIILSGQNTQGPVVVRYNTPGFKNVTLQVEERGCTSPVARYSLEVRPAPVFTIDADAEGCQDQPLDVIAIDATANIDSFIWDFGGGVPTSGTFNGGPYGVVYNTPGTYVITAQGYTRLCGSTTVQDTVRIEPTPVANIRGLEQSTVCTGDSVLLEADYNPTYTYTWAPEGFFNGSRDSRPYAIVSRTGYITLEVTTRQGCRATDSIYLSTKPCCDVFLPTAFSPNADGRNDVFRIRSNGFHTVHAFRVVNRWGQIVWSAGQQSNGWDGTIEGKPAEQGVYMYYLKYTCSDGNIYEKTGEVTIVR